MHIILKILNSKITVFFSGLFVGVCFGILIFSLLEVAKRATRGIESDDSHGIEAVLRLSNSSFHGISNN